VIAEFLTGRVRSLVCLLLSFDFLQIYRALESTLAEYAHLPLLWKIVRPEPDRTEALFGTSLCSPLAFRARRCESSTETRPIDDGSRWSLEINRSDSWRRPFLRSTIWLPPRSNIGGSSAGPVFG